jgi:hypothetical protein
MDTNNPDDLHTFTLCRDDWEIIIDALYATVRDRLETAEKASGTTYGEVLYDDAQKVRAVANYLEFFLPE